jgi:hypothetical protein
MNRRYLWLSILGLVIAAILAFFLEDVIRRDVITPLAYLVWALRLIYSAIPQLLMWILLLAGMVLIAISSLVHWFTTGGRYEEPSLPTRGPVEVLADWIRNSRQGLYYKWVIANRLGKLAHELFLNRDDREISIRGRKSSSEDVRRYLKAGLDESFVDYPAPALPFVRRQPTPFDLDIKDTVEYLEAHMEAASENKLS